jgi:hypothetical protein
MKEIEISRSKTIKMEKIMIKMSVLMIIKIPKYLLIINL